MALYNPLENNSERDRLKKLMEDGRVTEAFMRSLLDKHHISLSTYLYIVYPEKGQEIKVNPEYEHLLTPSGRVIPSRRSAYEEYVTAENGIGTSVFPENYFAGTDPTSINEKDIVRDDNETYPRVSIFKKVVSEFGESVRKEGGVNE